MPLGAMQTIKRIAVKSNFIKTVSTMAGLSWLVAFMILVLIYVYSFASVSAHISAMYAAFLSVSVVVGTPPLLAAIAFAALSWSPSTWLSGSASAVFGGKLSVFGNSKNLPGSNASRAFNFKKIFGGT